MRLYENLVDRAIDQKDYEIFRQSYEQKIEEAQDSIRRVEQERKMLVSREIGDNSWMEDFIKYRDLRVVERMAIVELIDRVIVGTDKIIEVRFRDDEEYELLDRFLKEYSETAEQERMNGEKEQKRTG